MAAASGVSCAMSEIAVYHQAHSDRRTRTFKTTSLNISSREMRLHAHDQELALRKESQPLKITTEKDG